MKKQFLLFTIFLGLYVIFSISLASAVTAQCCMINSSKCTFWDMGNWTRGSDFCIKLGTVISFNTTYFNVSCTAVSASIPTCSNGFIVCGDSVCEFPEDCGSCSQDCGACPPAPSVFTRGESGGKCIPSWGCDYWDPCINGTQTRTCTNSNPYCNTNKPATEQPCTMPAQQQTNESLNTTAQEQSQSSTQPGITGAFIDAIRSPAGIALILVILAGLVAGGFYLNNSLRQRKNKQQ